MYYNKRLHPRQYVVEHHRDGCMLHELEEQSRITRYSSLTALGNHAATDTAHPRRQRLSSTGSTGSGSTANLPPPLVAPAPLRRRDYNTTPAAVRPSSHPSAAGDWSVSVAKRMRNASRIGSIIPNTNTTTTTTTITTATTSAAGASSHVHPESDSSSSSTAAASIRSHSIKPTLSRKSSAHSLKNVHFSRDCVHHSADFQPPLHDSPEQIIAALFPGQAVRRTASTTTTTSTRSPTVPSRPANTFIKSTKSSAQRSAAAAAVVRTARPQQRPSFAVKSRANIYRPDSLQELSRDFEGIKYGIVCLCVCVLSRLGYRISV